MRYAVILAGGGGTRLWPASRHAHPKQFLALAPGGETLLAATARRLAPSCEEDGLVVVTAAAQASEVRRTLPKLAPEAILGEPTGRNTAAAIGLAAIHLHASDPDAVLGIVPSDQHVADEDAFTAAIDRAYAAAEAGDRIVTVGVVPNRAETGFGYLEVGDDEVEPGIRPVLRFVEKPDPRTAETYLESGKHLWNGGMFFARAARWLADLERFLPELRAGLEEIARGLEVSRARADEVAAEIYPGLPSVSIDYGVMEKTSGVVTVTGDFGWNDVGSFAALADVHKSHDDRGNLQLGGDAVLHDAAGNITISDDGVCVAVVGVEGLVVVQSGDGILVVPRHRAQEVREVVAKLRERGLDRYL